MNNRIRHRRRAPLLIALAVLLTAATVDAAAADPRVGTSTRLADHPGGQPADAAANDSQPVTCKRMLHLTLKPPITLDEQDHTFHERGVFADCSNGLNATLEFDGGTFHGSCKGGHAESNGGLIKWSDGTTSVEQAAADMVVPPFFTLSGQINRGKFAGRSTSSKGYLVPQDPQNCLTSGITDTDAFGDWTFQ